jgi:hypothetical protein
VKAERVRRPVPALIPTLLTLMQWKIAINDETISSFPCHINDESARIVYLMGFGVSISL